MSDDKLSLSEVLGIIDIGGSSMWDEFSDYQKKNIPFYVLSRWLSGRLSNRREDIELAILQTNEYYNKNYFDLTKHPQLQWMLASMIGGSGKKVRREWIGYKRKGANSKLADFILTVHPHLSDDEVKLFIDVNSVVDLKGLARDNGLTDDEIKKLF